MVVVGRSWSSQTGGRGTGRGMVVGGENDREGRSVKARMRAAHTLAYTCHSIWRSFNPASTLLSSSILLRLALDDGGTKTPCASVGQ